MIIPRFSLLHLLIGTFLCALFSLIIAQAVNGGFGAIAFAIAFGGLALVFMFYGIVFLVTWALALVVAPVRSKIPRSPFVSAEPPPQLHPPRAPDEL